MKNQAAWIPAAKAQIVVKDDDEIPTPGEGEVLVDVKWIGFSPIEAKIQRYILHDSDIPLLYCTHPLPYSLACSLSYLGALCYCLLIPPESKKAPADLSYSDSEPTQFHIPIFLVPPLLELSIRSLHLLHSKWVKPWP